MKITALEEYGLRCLVRVAREGIAEPLSAQKIAEREGLSLSYTQKVLRALIAGELLVATRGATGGYQLARPLEAISLGDAMRVLGGLGELERICERHTGAHEVCCNSEDCSLRPVWGYLTEFLVSTFDAIPLKLLTQREEVVKEVLRDLAPAVDASVSAHRQVSCPLDEHTM